MSMKLNTDQVLSIRALSDAGFSTRSIATAYRVTHRQVWAITRFHAWAFLPPSSVELPELLHEQTSVLRLRRRFVGLTPEQQRRVEAYAARLAFPELLRQWE